MELTISQALNQAVAAHKEGKLQEAEPLLRKALKSQEEVLGPKHPDTLTSLHDLGNLLMSMGKHREAEPLCRRAWETSEEVLQRVAKVPVALTSECQPTS